MTLNGVTKISVSVADMNKSLEFFVGDLGCTEVGKKSYSNGELKSIWSMADGITGEAVYLVQGEARPTLIELIEFTPKSTVYKRHQDKPNYVCGMLGIGFRVEDMQYQYKLLKEKYQFFNPPKPYTAPWTSNEVQEVLLWSPDNVPIPFMMSGVNEGKGFTSITTNAYITKDVDEADKFFTEVIGINRVFDRVMPNGLVNDILCFPDEDTPRITMYMSPGFNCPVPEAIQCQHPDAEIIYDVCEPQDIGLISAAYEVESLDKMLEKCSAAGYNAISHVAEMEIGPLGKVKTATIRAFNKEFFQFYEKIS